MPIIPVDNEQAYPGVVTIIKPLAGVTPATPIVIPHLSVSVASTIRRGDK